MYHKAPLFRINHSLSPDWSLNNSDVENLRKQYGLNNIVENPKNRWLELFIETIKDPMIWFLIGASLLFAILKNFNQTIILLLATIPLICMDAFLHWRTSFSTRSLANRLATTALVIRNGVETTISSLEIVPGDLIVMRPGMFFSGDGLIVKGKNIQIDESALTGEAFPASKKIITTLPDKTSEPSIDEIYWGFAGTRLLTGNAYLRVIFTGKETLYGEIVTSTVETANERTPLQKSISKLVFNLLIVASIICLILAIIRYYQGFGIIDAILSAAILAVAALPDEFPVVFTLFLGLGVYQLATKKALVRRAVSVENIGRTTCICSDKTGTITEGQFKLLAYFPNKDFNEKTLLQQAVLSSRLESGDPLDLAIYKEAEKEGVTFIPGLLTFPFTEDRKRETSIVPWKTGSFLIATKGSPEVILALSSLNAIDKARWLKKASEFAASGHKVIACAQYLTEINLQVEPEHEYQFSGLLVFSDPPRQEVPFAIKRCLESGIHVMMITGDHPETARTVAKQIGLGNGHPEVILAEDLNLKLQNENGSILRKFDVVARAIPSQKLSIVKALQEAGEMVAVTGDGVNDVPALKAADVGISMGERGTQSAREISDIVLLDDNFSSIVNAVAEGRQLFKNLKLSFQYLLMIHIPFVLSAAIIPLLGYSLLYLPIHIVWVELFIHPTAMLVFQEKTSLDQKLEPIKKNVSLTFFSKKEWLDIILIGTLTSLFVIFGYLYILDLGFGERARAFVLAFLGFFNIILIISLSEFKTVVQRSIALLIILLTLIFIQTPFIAKMFEVAPLNLEEWLMIISFSIITFIFLTLIKKL